MGFVFYQFQTLFESLGELALEEKCQCLFHNGLVGIPVNSKTISLIPVQEQIII